MNAVYTDTQYVYQPLKDGLVQIRHRYWEGNAQPPNYVFTVYVPKKTLSVREEEVARFISSLHLRQR